MGAQMSVKNYAQLLSDKEKQYALPVGLLSAMADQESGGDAKARSPKGAGGLLQLMPDTAKEMGVDDVNDPEQNADGGAKYMRLMLDQHNGDVPLALAAYNAGPAAVAEHGGIPPYPETQDYVAKITGKLVSQSDAPAGYEEVPAGYEEVTDNSAPSGYEDVPQGYEEAPAAQAMEEPKADIASITPKTTAQRVLGGLGALEAPVSMASAVPAALGGGLAFLGGLGKAALPEVIGGIPSTSSYVDYAKDAQEATQNAMTYQPASTEGQRTLGGIGAGMEAIGGAINAPASAVRGLGAMANGGDFSTSYQQGQQEGLAENLGIGLSSVAKGLGAGEPVQAGAYALGKTLPDAAMWAAPYLAKGAGATTEASAKAASNVIKPIPEALRASKLVDAVAQTKEKNIPAVKNTLSRINIRDIKNVKDIEGRVQKDIEDLSSKVDKFTTENKGRYTMTELDIPVTVGNEVVYDNAYKAGLSQLADLYAKTDDAAGQSRIRQLTEKANTSGLTANDMSGIAREHGRELNAFGANGELSTGMTKKSLERTRKGMTDTLKGIINNPEFTQLYKNMHESIKTKDVFSKLRERAYDIDKRAVEHGLFKKSVKVGVNAFDSLIGGLPSALASKYLKNGKTSYNASEAASLIGERLNKLDDIINAKDISVARKKAIIEKMQQGALSTPAAMETK